ncbi:hypothetical protein [Aquimarina sp. I32.4]|uniref:hypothetical protein n=1 Tax=Aquimarina sp. I32.4 TaxID=2053903 RepID=UPI000CDEB73D|nr:hypothetical protein [Aquimarina sp. I32.4]
MLEIKKLLKITILSSLVFFTMSFFSVLDYICNNNNLGLEIGFPCIYYYRFFVDDNDIRFGWNLKSLMIDIGVIWGCTLLIYVGCKKVNKYTCNKK